MSNKNTNIEKLMQLAYYDSLTGVYNRNSYEEKLDKIRQDDNSENIFVIFFDIDGLRDINNQYGHSAGDEAIKTVAKCIIVALKGKGDVYRIGGDEFVCIAECDLKQELMEFENMLYEKAKSLNYALTVSTGYSGCNKKARDIDSLIKYCDALMYEHKNRIKTK